MKILKRILCTILCVVILSTTVGTKYFDSSHMEKVEAVGAVVVAGGITLATIAEICLFVGSVALAVYGIGEAYENREEIARFGKEFIDSCSENAEGWVMQIVDASGQDYVFGSEALELVRSTEWSVIQGGLPPEGDPNKKDDKDKDKFHIPGDPMTHVAQFTALGATWFSVNAKNIYQDWCDILDGWVEKDRPIPLNNVLANNFPRFVSDADIAAQWSGTYNCLAHWQDLYYGAPPFDKDLIQNFYTINDSVSYPVAAVFSIGSNYDLSFFKRAMEYGNPVVYSCNLNGTQKIYKNGNLNGTYNLSSCNLWSSLTVNGKPVIYSYGCNVPVFLTYEAAQSYLLGQSDGSDAINYVKDYRIADWLQQDWAGTLIDPLVNIGLTLTQLIELCRQLGIKVAQGLTAQQLLELLINAFPKLDPALLPGATPTPIVVDPDVDPIYYPDPDAHPDKPPRPVIDPDPSIGTPPLPNPDPKPGIDPDPDPAPLPDMDAADYQVDLKSIFPFCIPFDFIDLLNVLDAKPRAPCFTFPVVIPALEYREDVKFDMSIFDDVAKVIRLCEKVSFILFLMFVTSKVIRW